MVPVVVLWMLWVKVVVVVFLLFLYSLFNFRWSIRWVTLVGHSIWAVYGQLIVWVDGAGVYCGLGASSGLRSLPWNGGSGAWGRCWGVLRYDVGL